ncbi:MAG: mechanosensitive ion channel family protein [Opitutales bacterium]|jgi:small-conductance mechanosensitive channel
MTADSFWTASIEVGTVSFTPVSLLMGTTLIILALLLKRILHRVLTRRFFPRFNINPGLANAYSTLIGYVFLILALFIILPITISGLNWSTLSVVLGAVSFGVGFGLRNIADNFVSGLIILLERPIKVGDRITVDATSGTVTSIRARSTTVRTNDNIEVIVPNSRFISEPVTNWSHTDNNVRFRIPVGVHYKSDVNQVKQVLEAAAVKHAHVLSYPVPEAAFVEFGDSSLNFEVWVWTLESTQRPSGFKSEINYLIWNDLKEAGIEIPYPQRDLYIKELPPSGKPGGVLEE